LDVEAWGHYRLLGKTRDDAAGEGVRQSAKLLGLPYPGGPHVERLAALSGRRSLPIRATDAASRSSTDDPDFYDLSLERSQAAVLNVVKAADRDGNIATDRGAIACAFQDALIETLVEKTARAVRQFGRWARGARRRCGLQRHAGDRHAGSIRAPRG